MAPSDGERVARLSGAAGHQQQILSDVCSDLLLLSQANCYADLTVVCSDGSFMWSKTLLVVLGQYFRQVLRASDDATHVFLPDFSVEGVLGDLRRLLLAKDCDEEEDSVIRSDFLSMAASGRPIVKTEAVPAHEDSRSDVKLSTEEILKRCPKIAPKSPRGVCIISAEPAAASFILLSGVNRLGAPGGSQLVHGAGDCDLDGMTGQDQLAAAAMDTDTVQVSPLEPPADLKPLVAGCPSSNLLSAAVKTELADTAAAAAAQVKIGWAVGGGSHAPPAPPRQSAGGGGEPAKMKVYLKQGQTVRRGQTSCKGCGLIYNNRAVPAECECGARLGGKFQKREYVQCSFCPYKTKQGGNMKKHVDALHRGVRHLCDHCGFKATEKQSLMVHIQSKHNGVRYDCPHCSYRAFYKGNLREHIRARHEGVRYLCDYCGHEATQKQSLKRHVLHVHKKDYVPTGEIRSNVDTLAPKQTLIAYKTDSSAGNLL